MNDVNIHPTWQIALADYFDTNAWQKTAEFVRNEYQTQTIYPKPSDIFNTFNLTPFDQVRVVILGQDPYHGPGQAHGLCFSVQDGVTPPPSLKNIYKEIQSDLGIEKDFEKGNLTSWTDQGVLLLNSILSVRARKAASHHGHGWEEFTDHVMQKLSDQREHLVFMLWGNYAKQKGAVIDRSRHLVLESLIHHHSRRTVDSLDASIFQNVMSI